LLGLSGSTTGRWAFPVLTVSVSTIGNFANHLTVVSRTLTLKFQLLSFRFTSERLLLDILSPRARTLTLSRSHAQASAPATPHTRAGPGPKSKPDLWWEGGGCRNFSRAL
jgi:hypothetical protein